MWDWDFQRVHDVDGRFDKRSFLATLVVYWERDALPSRLVRVLS